MENETIVPVEPTPEVTSETPVEAIPEVAPEAVA